MISYLITNKKCLMACPSFVVRFWVSNNPYCQRKCKKYSCIRPYCNPAISIFLVYYCRLLLFLWNVLNVAANIHIRGFSTRGYVETCYCTSLRGRKKWQWNKHYRYYPKKRNVLLWWIQTGQLMQETIPMLFGNADNFRAFHREMG